MDIWQMIQFLGNSWHVMLTGHGKSKACRVPVFVWSEKEKHFHSASMTDTNLRVSSWSVPESTNMQYSLGTIYLSLYTVNFFVLYHVFSVPSCFAACAVTWPDLDSLTLCSANVALKQSKHTSCSPLRPRPIIRIRLISFSAMFAFIN